MGRIVARTSQALIDLAVLTLALWLAFMFRFDWDVPLQMFKRLLFLWPYVAAFQYVVLLAFGVTRFSWRFIGLREAERVLLAAGTASVGLLAMRIAAGAALPHWPHAQYALLPFGIIAADLMLVFVGITGVRVLRRMVGERTERRRRGPSGHQVATLLIGAGQAGVMVAKELAVRPDIGMRPVGFLDDDPMKVGTVLHGLPVLGTTADLAQVAAKHRVEQVLIAIANASGKDIRRITLACREAGHDPKIIPGIYEIVGGQVNLSRIREVAIEDLLGRAPVELDEAAIERVVRGRVVLVTGAGGSIGSELCRQVCRFGPERLVLVEQAENALFHIHRELLERNRCITVEPCVGDVTDALRMGVLFERYRPAVVFHAAAHKHVPMMEWNPGEAVKNNVFGTRTLADLADRTGVSEFVMISTDKAVNPTSVMGATKRAAEIYVQALSQRSKTRFVTVRFGNVLGSAGSVIPIFKEQIERGGPVTVTHPDMKRYFMTIPEACQLVLQAGAMGQGGEIFILDMGEPVHIVDLARDLIRLSGFEPGEDIEIAFSGLRPGEKLFEELSVADENADKTLHPKIFVGRIRPHGMDEVQHQYLRLEDLLDEEDGAAIRSALRELVPEYRPEMLTGGKAKASDAA